MPKHATTMKKHHINEDSDSKTIQVAQGDTIELTLEESPTTGYRWEISEMDAQQIQLTDQHYTPHKEAGQGGGGIRTYHLKVLDKGPGQIALENRQRWEGDVYKTFSIRYE